MAERPERLADAEVEARQGGGFEQRREFDGDAIIFVGIITGSINGIQSQSRTNNQCIFTDCAFKNVFPKEVTIQPPSAATAFYVQNRHLIR